MLDTKSRQASLLGKSVVIRCSAFRIPCPPASATWAIWGPGRSLYVNAVLSPDAASAISGAGRFRDRLGRDTDSLTPAPLSPAVDKLDRNISTPSVYRSCIFGLIDFPPKLSFLSTPPLSRGEWPQEESGRGGAAVVLLAPTRLLLDLPSSTLTQTLLSYSGFSLHSKYRQ